MRGSRLRSARFRSPWAWAFSWIPRWCAATCTRRRQVGFVEALKTGASSAFGALRHRVCTPARGCRESIGIFTNFYVPRNNQSCVARVLTKRKTPPACGPEDFACPQGPISVNLGFNYADETNLRKQCGCPRSDFDDHVGPCQPWAVHGEGFSGESGRRAGESAR